MVQHKQLLLVAIQYNINAAGHYTVQHKQMLLVIIWCGTLTMLTPHSAVPCHNVLFLNWTEIYGNCGICTLQKRKQQEDTFKVDLP